jgi:hypothetical protein
MSKHKKKLVRYYGIHTIETIKTEGWRLSEGKTAPKGVAHWIHSHKIIWVDGVETPIRSGLWGCEWGYAYSDGEKYWGREEFFSLTDFLIQRGWLPPGMKIWLWPRRSKIIRKHFPHKKWWQMWA